MSTGVTVMIVTTLILPFAFVIAILWLKSAARNRQFAQIMEERKLMIEKGMEPPKLEIPDDPVEGGKKDPLANLKAGLIMLGMGIAVSIARYTLTASGPLLGNSPLIPVHWALSIARFVFLALGPTLIVIHFISRAYAAKDDIKEVE